METVELHNMDVAIKYTGVKKFWPPSQWLGPAIETYQKRRYAWAINQRPRPERTLIWRAVHCLLYFENPQEFFEFTYPKAKWTAPDDALRGGYRLFRWRHEPLDANRAIALALEYEGSEYDIGELLDFRLIPTLGLPQWRIFGSTQSFVCSTGMAMLLSSAGARFREREDTIPPAYWPVYSQDWRML